MLLTNAYNFSRIFKLKSGLNLSSTPRIVSFMMKFQTGQFSRKHSGNILVSQHLHRLSLVLLLLGQSTHVLFYHFSICLSEKIPCRFIPVNPKRFGEYYRAYPLELSSMHSVFFLPIRLQERDTIKTATVMNTTQILFIILQATNLNI